MRGGRRVFYAFPFKYVSAYIDDGVLGFFVFNTYYIKPIFRIISTNKKKLKFFL